MFILFFYGVKFGRTRNPPKNSDFILKTMFQDYYYEIGHVSEIPVKLEIDVVNVSKKIKRDIETSIIGMREDYHQKIGHIESNLDINTWKDSSGNYYHTLVVPLIKPRKSVRIEIYYTIVTRPYQIGQKVDLIIEKQEIEKLMNVYPYQKHTSNKIKDIAAKLNSNDPMRTIMNVAGWVLKNIAYEKTYRRLSVTDTINRRRGSCLSISDLIVAILRACSIPVRVIRGLYMDRPHAWVEAYISRNELTIVPIDVLGGMVGGLGSIWISRYAELTPTINEADAKDSDIRVSCRVIIPQ